MSLSFCQALAEALKTNVSVTRIDLDHNSIGDGGVKALCVPGFQVAAHGAFVASLVKGFVVCVMLILRISRFQILLTVSEVGELLFELNLFDVV